MSEIWDRDLDLSLASEPWAPFMTNLDHQTISSEQLRDDNDEDEAGHEGADWGAPAEVTSSLVELFFDNAQSWLTFIHRTNFHNRFMWSDGERCLIVERSAVSDDEAFLVYCMFAIAARFSKSAHFANVSAPDRGETYANRAAALKNSTLASIEEPSLDFLKGCVILAFYYLSAGQIGPGSVLTSVCVRFAYDLSLDEVDQDKLNDDGSLVSDSSDESADSWLKKEELRRLWWSIWEIDTFVSTLSLQPYGIEKVGIEVLLPAPDLNWLSGVPIRSAFIDTRPESLWKSLQGSPNQSVRAWFLLANYLKSDIVLAARQRSSRSTKEKLEAALCNFKLALPSDFQLRSLFLDGQIFEQANWVISTHLIIIASETILARSTWTSQEYSELDSHVCFPQRITSYLVSIGQVWIPEYIPLCHPIICCAVVAPCSTDVERSEFAARAHEVAKLILGHYAKYWKLASQMLRLLSTIEQGQPLDNSYSSSGERQVIPKQYAALLPSMTRRRRVSNAHSAQLKDGGRNMSRPPPASNTDLALCDILGSGNSLSAFGDFDLDQALECPSTLQSLL